MHIRAGQAHAKRWNDALKTGLTPLSLSAQALGQYQLHQTLQRFMLYPSGPN